MTPEERQELNQLRQELNLLRTLFYTGEFPDKKFVNKKYIFQSGIALDPLLSAISPPTGGGVIDTQGRVAINDIITTLENAGIVVPN